MPSPSRTVEMINASMAGRAKKKRKPNAEAKAARIAAYEARCAALKAGTFKGIVEQAAEAKARDAAEREAETENARKVVVAHMSHPQYGQRLSRFLNGSKADPVRLANIVIPNWLRSDGRQYDHVAPTT